MMKPTKPVRIVGIAVSKKNLGFCVLEQPDFLLDWGVKKMKDRKPETIEKLLSHIFDFYTPTNVIVEVTYHAKCKLSKDNIHVIKYLVKLAQQRGVFVNKISWEETKTQLQLNTTDNMNTLLQAVGDIYPILSTHMPQKRKPWDSEHRKTVEYKAVALCLNLHK